MATHWSSFLTLHIPYKNPALSSISEQSEPVGIINNVMWSFLYSFDMLKLVQPSPWLFPITMKPISAEKCSSVISLLKDGYPHCQIIAKTCYVPYHRSNSISVSAQDTLQMHSWSSYIISCMLPLPVWTIPILARILRHPTICKNTFTLSLALHLSTDSAQHMYTYSASWSTVMHGADTICSVSLATRLYYSSTCYSYISTCYFQNLPHACCPLLPIMFHPFSI